MELLLGVKFLETSEIINNNAGVVDTCGLNLMVNTNNVNPATGECYEIPIAVELDLGYNWDTCEYESEDMFVRITKDRLLERWVALQGIDPAGFEEKLTKLLSAIYVADNSKYKRYFWTTQNVWFYEWDF